MHWNQANIPPTWNGRRIFAVDGSKLNLPHELVHAGYKIQNACQSAPLVSRGINPRINGEEFSCA